MPRHLHTRIREARRLASLSRAELARRVNVRPSAAVQWEQENGTAPAVRNLIKIATITNVSFEWLATGRGVRQSPTLREIPAVDVGAFAESGFEEELLHLARDLPVRLQEPLLM